MTLGESARVGHLVVPVAYGPRAALGLLSQIGGPWRTAHGAEVDAWIEVDGSLPRGFSGGPLLSANGQVLGMNTHKLARGGTTLPTSTLKRVVALLESRGTVEPGYLGIGGAAATLTQDQAAIAKQPHALLVVAVEPGSPAEGVLTVGDILLEIGGKSATNVAELRATLTGLGAGKQVSVAVLTGSGVEQRSLTLATRPNTCT